MRVLDQKVSEVLPAPTSVALNGEISWNKLSFSTVPGSPELNFLPRLPAVPAASSALRFLAIRFPNPGCPLRRGFSLTRCIPGYPDL